MATIRIGGVPEHFNLPIHLAIEEGLFDEKGLKVEWTTFDGGTGQMTKALRDDDIDLCVLLTEGIIADIIKGNPSKIISTYVNTPLTWGIHTGSKNNLSHHQDIYDKNYAISRYGSGSHLIAIVDALSNDKKISEDQWKVIRNLEGALTSLEALETDVFYWEKYTTKPFVDSGQLRRVGEFVTPWPCFVIAAREETLNSNHDEVVRLLRVIHDRCDLFMQNETNIKRVAKRYQIKEQDAERWYHSTEWAMHGWVSDKMVKSVMYNLKAAGIIESPVPIDQVIHFR